MTTRTPGSHLAARFSIIAGFACFLGNCLANQVIAKFGVERAGWLGQTVGWLTMLLVLGGIALGIAGLVGGRRRQSVDTMGVALIGLLLNLGIFALTLYGLWVIARTASGGA